MIAVEKINSAKVRVASYYLGQLRQMSMSHAYRAGGENITYALQHFDAEYNQMEHILIWLADNAAHWDAVAKLFSDILATGQALFTYRLPAAQCLTLHERALSAVQFFNNAPAILLHQLAIADAHLAMNNVVAALEFLKQAESIAEAIGDRSRLAQCRYDLSFAYSELGQEAEATQKINEALALYRQFNDRQNAGFCLFRLAQIELRKGEWDAANANLSSAYQIAIQYDNQGHIHHILQKLGELREREGNLVEALEHKKRALELAQQLGNQSDIVLDLISLGISHDVKRDFATAQEYYREGLKIANKMGFKRQKTLLLGNLGYSAYLQGDYSVAAAYLREALQMVRDAGQQSMVCVILANLVPVSVGLDDTKAAYQAVCEGLDIAHKLENKQLQIMMLVTAVQVRVAMAANQDVDIAEAVQWTGLIYTSPFAEQENRDELDKLCPQMEKMLGAERVAELLRQGEQLNLSDVLDDLQDELRKMVDA